MIFCSIDRVVGIDIKVCRLMRHLDLALFGHPIITGAAA